MNQEREKRRLESARLGRVMRAAIEEHERVLLAANKSFVERFQVSQRPPMTEETLSRIVDVISPAHDQVDSCIETILRRLAILAIAEVSERNATSAQLRDQFRAASAALKQARTAIEQMYNSGAASWLTVGITMPHGWDPEPGYTRKEILDFCAMALRIEERTAFIGDNFHVAPGKPAKSELKTSAAAFAYDLLTSFGKTPTLTTNGPFFVLADLLYEATTGDTADLEHVCRLIWHAPAAE